MGYSVCDVTLPAIREWVQSSFFQASKGSLSLLFRDFLSYLIHTRTRARTRPAPLPSLAGMLSLSSFSCHTKSNSYKLVEPRFNYTKRFLVSLCYERHVYFLTQPTYSFHPSPYFPPPLHFFCYSPPCHFSSPRLQHSIKYYSE